MIGGGVDLLKFWVFLLKFEVFMSVVTMLKG